MAELFSPLMLAAHASKPHRHVAMCMYSRGRRIAPISSGPPGSSCVAAPAWSSRRRPPSRPRRISVNDLGLWTTPDRPLARIVRWQVSGRRHVYPTRPRRPQGLDSHERRGLSRPSRRARSPSTRVTTPQELTVADLDGLSPPSGQARSAPCGGFRCVEIHGAHGISSTSSCPAVQPPGDQYAGHWRTEPDALRVVDASTELGEAKPLLVRLSCSTGSKRVTIENRSGGALAQGHGADWWIARPAVAPRRSRRSAGYQVPSRRRSGARQHRTMRSTDHDTKWLRRSSGTPCDMWRSGASCSGARTGRSGRAAWATTCLATQYQRPSRRMMLRNASAMT